MKAPLCPNCREGMSSVEHGLGGVWSCLYCEGTWLPAEQLKALATAAGGDPNVASSPVQPLQVCPTTESLACPRCEASWLETVSLGAFQAHRCIRCQGAFFTRGVVAMHAPQLISRSQEAPIASTLLAVIGTVAMLGDPLPIIAALAWQSAEKSAP
jgi:Zn-finger nucleic acid-binding protein